jgi:hypothetical protein
MKNINKIIALLFLISAVVIFPGCKKYFDKTDNPNLVQDPSVNSMLTSATQKAGLNTQRFASFNTFYTQYQASPTASSATDTYQITDNSSQWNNAYYAMADLYDMITKAQSTGATEHLGVAQLLMAYHLGLVADTWGSAPYTEAFGSVVTLNPTYDSEESLYQSSMTLIDQSIANLQLTTATIALDPASDLVHAGSRTAWLKTAYGIKARFLNKISKKSTYNAAAVLTAVASSYTDATTEAKMNVFLGVNPWAQLAIGNSSALLGGWLSDNFINSLNGTTYGIFDPRIEKITDRTVNNNYVGTRNGTGNLGGSNTVRDENYISVSSPLTTQSAPVFILTYSEIKFIQSEAAFRAGDRVTAYEAYLAGIRANMTSLGVAISSPASVAYLASVSVGAANLTLDQIFKEKYIALYLSPESWNDLRRHDYKYKDFRLPVGAVLTNFIRRVAYPNDERTRNGANVPAEVSLDAPLWWDKP